MVVEGNGVLSPDDAGRLAYVTAHQRRIDLATVDSLATVPASTPVVEAAARATVEMGNSHSAQPGHYILYNRVAIFGPATLPLGTPRRHENRCPSHTSPKGPSSTYFPTRLRRR